MHGSGEGGHGLQRARLSKCELGGGAPTKCRVAPHTRPLEDSVTATTLELSAPIRGRRVWRTAGEALERLREPMPLVEIEMSIVICVEISEQGRRLGGVCSQPQPLQVRTQLASTDLVRLNALVESAERLPSQRGRPWQGRGRRGRHRWHVRRWHWWQGWRRWWQSGQGWWQWRC